MRKKQITIKKILKIIKKIAEKINVKREHDPPMSILGHYIANFLSKF
ncbi:MAG: hypothetical protein GXP60_02655 [Epsilonproteobacteria bacterium]|nr:hypothetical protein [Campylobacterota bacterium]